jgi:hypothetical protein
VIVKLLLGVPVVEPMKTVRFLIEGIAIAALTWMLSVMEDTPLELLLVEEDTALLQILPVDHTALL